MRGERLRVAYCIDNMGPGGTESNAVRTAERLDRSRFALSVITFRADGIMAARYAAAGIPVLPFPVPGGFATPGAARQLVRLARFLARHRFDVVHSHDRYTNIFAVAAARLAGTPTIIASKRWWRAGGLEIGGRFFQAGNTAAYHLAHRVLANSDAVATSVREVERVRADRIAVVPNFVDDGAFDDLRPGERERMLHDLGVPHGSLVVGIVARLRPIKDHESLFRAAAALRSRWPALRVVLVGDGGSQGDLEARARALGIDDVVHFAGHRSQEPNPHRLFDVSVLCSLSEGFPNSIVEAMAAARPVVASDVGGIPDAVADGETGLLVPPRRPDRLADAIDALLRDPARRAAMGAAGQRRARERFHAASVVPRLERLYDQLHEQQAGRSRR